MQAWGLLVCRRKVLQVLPEYRTLLTGFDGGVVTLTLNRPERRNAFGDGMRDELADAYTRCNEADDVRVVVLTGAPPAFCAGADLAAGDQTFTAPGPDFSAAGIPVPAWSLSKPVIAAVNGHAIGLGLTLALQCDVRIFAADARYGVVQVRRGVVGDAYAHWALPRLVGIARAAEILLTGTIFDGNRAAELGIASRVLPADEVLPAALVVAHDIADNTAPVSIALTRQMLWRFAGAPDPFELLKVDGAYAFELGGGPDVREGVAAFLEKRAPDFPGKVSTDMPSRYPWWE